MQGLGSSLLAVLAAALLFAGAACSHQRSDSEIIGDVVTRMQADPNLAAKHIAVISKNGVVTLNGSADTDAQRLQASQIAGQVEGVKTVLNDVVVAAPVATAVVPPVAPIEEAKAEPPAPVERSTRTVSKSSKPPAAHQKQTPIPTAAGEKQSTTASTTAANKSNLPIIYTNDSSSPAVSSVNPMGPISSAMPNTPAPKPIQLISVPSGTALNIRLIDSIDTEKNTVGETFRASLASPVYVDDRVVIPAGAGVSGKITSIETSGRFTGRPQVGLELTSFMVNNRRYLIHTSEFTRQGGSQGSRTAKSVGGGAAIGALIGAVAGGGKGAAIGAAVGAGAGGGVQAARGAQQVKLPSETRLSFRLENPISVVPADSADSGATYDDEASANNGPEKVYRDDDPSETDPNRPVLKRRPPRDPNDNNN